MKRQAADRRLLAAMCQRAELLDLVLLRGFQFVLTGVRSNQRSKSKANDTQFETEIESKRDDLVSKSIW